jgi:hypothetical protein
MELQDYIVITLLCTIKKSNIWARKVVYEWGHVPLYNLVSPLKIHLTLLTRVYLYNPIFQQDWVISRKVLRSSSSMVTVDSTLKKLKNWYLKVVFLMSVRAQVSAQEPKCPNAQETNCPRCTSGEMPKCPTGPKNPWAQLPKCPRCPSGEVPKMPKWRNAQVPNRPKEPMSPSVQLPKCPRCPSGEIPKSPTGPKNPWAQVTKSPRAQVPKIPAGKDVWKFESLKV